jgi:hypothetical protein
LKLPAAPKSITSPMNIQAVMNTMNSNRTYPTLGNRFAALSVDDEPAPAPASAPASAAPRRVYVPPHVRRTLNQAPTTQSRLTAPPKVSIESEFPSLGARHAPVAAKPAAAAGAGAGDWASKARDWANYDETAEAVERERKRKEEEKASMITLTRPAYRSPAKPTLSPGTSEFHTNAISNPRYPIQPTDEEDNDDVDAAEAYVGGYDCGRYAAFDYEETVEDQYGPQSPYDDGRYTPPYPPTPY